MIERTFGLRPDAIFEGEKLPNTHPGEILREALEDLGITAYQLSKGLRVEQTRISEILAGKRAITADTAWRLARFLGTSPDLWMNLQSHYELLEAEDRNRETYKQIVPHERKPAAIPSR